MISVGAGNLVRAAHNRHSLAKMALRETDVIRNGNFFNLYNHDFVRIAVGVPSVRVADPAYNAEQTVALIREASERKAVVALFPELGLTAYSCDDLFQQRALLDACLDAIAAVIEATAKLSVVSVVGAPLQVDNHLYNCAIVIHRGKILGVVPKTNLPNYREFYEPRQFSSADAATRDEIDLLANRGVPFGNNLIFQHEEQPLLAIHAEICEDLWVPISPSSYAALAGATLLLNLSASNEVIGKPAYRRELVANQSGRCLAGYVYSCCGVRESTTDLIFAGHCLIGENGSILAESNRFQRGP